MHDDAVSVCLRRLLQTDESRRAHSRSSLDLSMRLVAVAAGAAVAVSLYALSGALSSSNIAMPALRRWETPRSQQGVSSGTNRTLYRTLSSSIRTTGVSGSQNRVLSGSRRRAYVTLCVEPKSRWGAPSLWQWQGVVAWA